MGKKFNSYRRDAPGQTSGERKGLGQWITIREAALAGLLGVLVGVLALAVIFKGIKTEQRSPAEVAVEEAPAQTSAPVVVPTSPPTATPSPLTVAVAAVQSNAEWAPFAPYVREFGGVEMALVPAGCFMMGSEEGRRDAQPVHEQCFEEPFWIGRYEVTNAQFADFLNQMGNQTEGNATWLDAEDAQVHIRESGGFWTPDEDFANHPATEVTWFGAAAFCQSRGIRLPTEAEWEYAARGPDGLVYPWGNDFVADNVVYSGNSNSQTAAVGSRPAGASWVGAHDLSGNVVEWVSSIYEDYPYQAADGREAYPTGDGISRRVRRGGAWLTESDKLGSANRGWSDPLDTPSSNGFRCARPF